VPLLLFLHVVIIILHVCMHVCRHAVCTCCVTCAAFSLSVKRPDCQTYARITRE